MPADRSNSSALYPVLVTAILGMASSGVATFFAVKAGVENNQTNIKQMTQSIEKLANSVHDLSLQTKIDLTKHATQIEEIERRVTVIESHLK